MKKITKLIFMGLLAGVALNSCNQEEVAQLADLATQQDVQVQYVPFFELAKGDTIPKGICREKPEFADDVTILFSSEEYEKSNPLMKAVGSSEGTSGYFITDIKTSVRDQNNAPNTMDGYTKIPVDLNEGAGGKYIYLYYKKGGYAGNFMALNAFSSAVPLPPYSSSSGTALGRNFSNGMWTDLNNGAGGPFIYIEGIFAQSPIDPLTRVSDILVISSSGGMSSYSGWIFINQDLNQGAGGKYIYLCYKVR